MEEDYGRARAMQQGIDSDEKLQEAIDTCPVNCIHWVRSRQQRSGITASNTTWALMGLLSDHVGDSSESRQAEMMYDAETVWCIHACAGDGVSVEFVGSHHGQDGACGCVEPDERRRQRQGRVHGECGAHPCALTPGWFAACDNNSC